MSHIMTAQPDRDGWTIGKCAKCGTPWMLHELMNVNSPSVNNCSSCGEPKYSREVIDRVNEMLSRPQCTMPWGGLV